MSTKVVNRVNITIDEELRYVLDTMKKVYPTLSYSDLIRMATGGYFASNFVGQSATKSSKKSTQKTKKLSKQEIDEWADTLPEMKLTPEQEAELEEAMLYNQTHKNEGRTYSHSEIHLMMEDLMNEER